MSGLFLSYPKGVNYPVSTQFFNQDNKSRLAEVSAIDSAVFDVVVS